jgi:hypothetical protein
VGRGGGNIPTNDVFNVCFDIKTTIVLVAVRFFCPSLIFAGRARRSPLQWSSL